MTRTPSPRFSTLFLWLTTASLSALACAKKEVVDPPPEPVATSIEITPATPAAIDAIGATLQLMARVLDQNGNQISGLSVGWSSDNLAVATVDAISGQVTAVDNGGANITATSGTLSSSVAVSVAQAAGEITRAGGDSQSATIGALLGASLVAQVNDRLGTSMGAGVGVTFAVTSGGGSVGSSTATTDASGQVSTTWTLGTTAGTQEVTASLTGNGTVNTVFSANALAGAADSLVAARGDMQSGILNQALTDSLVAKVVDAFGNGVPGVQVLFAATTGGGAVSPTSANTGLNGEAATSWTLGNSVGIQSVEATSGTLKGSPVTFVATATALSISSISPNPMVEGAAATITGTGFDTTPANNTVTVGGVAATVNSATGTTLTITVPTRNCAPAEDANVVVSAGGGSSPSFAHRVHPASPLSLTSGEQLIITSPAQFCLQFLPDATGGDEYLIGVGATHDQNAAVSYQLVAQAGAAMAPMQPSVVIAPAATAFARPLSPAEEAQATWQLRRDAAEARLRQWERDHMDPARYPELWTHVSSGSRLAAAGAAAAQVVPSVGAQITFNVPDINNNICTDFTTITTTVRTVGTKGIIVTDNANPTTDSLTIAELTSFSSSFDNTIATVDQAYFGVMTDLDTNARAFMVLTQEVNRFGGVAGFVASVDLVPASSCASSDFGEVFYGYVPDPANTTGGGATTHQSVVDNMLPLIAHEVAHIHQQSRRISQSPSAPFMAAWESEGQADLAKEVVAHAMFGNSPGNDYTNATVVAPGMAGLAWYQQRFTRLGLYFGWAGGGNRVPGNTPEECSLFGHSGAGVPCLTSYFYGSGWAFHRYINDRYGPAYPGGEQALQRAWVDNNTSSVAGVQSLLGVSFDTLFAEWAAMLYADGRPITGLPVELQMTSWDMAEIYSRYTAAMSLQPTARTFGAFTATGDVRKGSTAYTLLTAAAGQRGALAIRLRDLADQIMASGDKPQLWVLRTK